ncbi:hypothetical protein QYE76_056421 [Lolium multiflorum]|uniref:Uncharacterized protein n=1 Tax=Lolium multiflorum TaxID=4521 RepID=A0AAD8T1K4_LOLMU|nr:hypothetical protein QYE76_056421 [Lolium multiflorum]
MKGLSGQREPGAAGRFVHPDDKSPSWGPRRGDEWRCSNQLGIHRVLQSLPPSYKNFVMNYNMQNMNKELPELFSMLKSAEVEIQKEHQVLMVNKTTKFKKQGKPKKDLKKGGKKAAAHLEA